MLDAFGSIWVSSRHTDTVYRIDPATNAITALIPVGAEPSYFVSDGSAVWVVEQGSDALSRIDPRTNTTAEVVLGWAEYDSPTLVVGGGAVWGGTEAPSIAKIDIVSHKKVGTIDLPGQGATPESEPDAVFAGGLLWVFRRTGSGADSGVGRYDPKTLRLVDTVLPGRSLDVFGLGSDGDVIWGMDGRSVVTLDIPTGRILSSHPRPDGFDTVVLSGGHLWLTRLFPESFAPMNTHTGLAGTVRALPGPTTYDLRFLDRGPHDLWISDWDNNVVYRVDPAT